MVLSRCTDTTSYRDLFRNDGNAGFEDRKDQSAVIHMAPIISGPRLAQDIRRSALYCSVPGILDILAFDRRFVRLTA